MAALDGTGTMEGKSDVMRGEIVKKGIAYQGVWMFVVNRLEDAIDECTAGNSYKSRFAVDEAWAVYAGSLEGNDGSGSGQMIHALAEKRCKDFGTCEQVLEGEAKVNNEIRALFVAARDKIHVGQCTVSPEFNAIRAKMAVPLIQGMLKYAFKSDPANAQGSCTSGICDKEWAEGWAFAAAVLPSLDNCNPSVAELVRENLDVANDAPMTDGFAQLKAQVQMTYSCLGVTCADVGAFQNSAGIFTGMEVCNDAAVAAQTPETNGDGE